MVITRRHGTIKLDKKPCRTSRACVHSYQRSETLSDISTSGTWRLDPRTSEVDTPNYQPVTSHIAYVQCEDKTSLVSDPNNYDVASNHYDVASNHILCVKRHNSVFSKTSDISTEPFNNEVALDPVLSLHPDRLLSPAITSSTTSGTPPVTSRLTHRPGLLPFSFDLGFKELRVVFIYLIFSMFLICKGCVCSVCSGNTSPSNDLPSYLNVQFNLSKVGYQSDHGTCLTMTGSYVDAICNNSAGERRMRLLNSVNTNFCGLPLHLVLSDKQRHIVSNCSKEKCSSVLQEIEQHDAELSEQYCLFKDVLDRMDCREVYSYGNNCSLCEDAYKEWLCSIYVTRFYAGEPIKPCIEFCDRVSETCPFFRPYGETTIGEPGFLCKDPNININQHNAAVSLYGPEGCCFQPPHLCDDVMTCTTFNVTSNCTVARASSAAPGLSPPNPSGLLCIYVCIFILWASQALSRYSCIGLT